MEGASGRLPRSAPLRRGRTGTLPGAEALPLSSRRGKWLRSGRAEVTFKPGGAGWGGGRAAGGLPLLGRRRQQHPAARERRRRRAAKCSGAAARSPRGAGERVSPAGAGTGGGTGTRPRLRLAAARRRPGTPRGPEARPPTPPPAAPHPPHRARPAPRRGAAAGGTRPVAPPARDLPNSAAARSQLFGLGRAVAPGAVRRAVASPAAPGRSCRSGCGRQTNKQALAHKVALRKSLIKTMPLAMLRHLCRLPPLPPAQRKPNLTRIIMLS